MSKKIVVGSSKEIRFVYAPLGALLLLGWLLLIGRTYALVVVQFVVVYVLAAVTHELAHYLYIYYTNKKQRPIVTLNHIGNKFIIKTTYINLYGVRYKKLVAAYGVIAGLTIIIALHATWTATMLLIIAYIHGSKKDLQTMFAGAS